MSEQPLAVGLVGAGMIGAFRAQALGRLASTELVGVFDTNRSAATTVADGAQVCDTIEQLLALPRLDAIIVSTPPVTHEAIGLAALSSGRHVLCEKPLAASVAACERLVSAAEDAGMVLATGFTLRHTEAARLARRLLEEGAIGQLDHVRAFHGHAGGKDFGPAWIVDHAATGGGTLMDNGIHMIDMVRWFLGDVESAVGFTSDHVWHKPGCEDNGFVLLRDTAGRVGSIHSSWTEWRGYGYRVEIYGTAGCIRFGYPPLWLNLVQGTPGEKMKTRRYFFPRYQLTERLRGWQWSFLETLVADTSDWVEAIRNGQPAPASGRDGLESVRIAHAVREDPQL